MPDAASWIITSRRLGGSISISSTLQPELVPGSQSSAPMVFIALPLPLATVRDSTDRLVELHARCLTAA